jgi:hypothetical protein
MLCSTNCCSQGITCSTSAAAAATTGSATVAVTDLRNRGVATIFDTALRSVFCLCDSTAFCDSNIAGTVVSTAVVLAPFIKSAVV